MCWSENANLHPPAVRQRQVANYTDVAKKYSHPIGNWLRQADNRIIRNTGKSGLTPLPPTDPDEMITNKVQVQRAKLHEYEIYQRRRLCGFTPGELVAIETAAPFIPDSLKSNLHNAIHPIFEQRWWVTETDLPKNMGLIPLLGEYDGFYTVSCKIGEETGYRA